MQPILHTEGDLHCLILLSSAGDSAVQLYCMTVGFIYVIVYSLHGSISFSRNRLT